MPLPTSRSTTFEKPSQRRKARLDAESNKKSPDRLGWSRHPLAAVILGFALTAPLGGGITYYYSYLQKNRDIGLKTIDAERETVSTYLDRVGAYSTTAAQLILAIQSRETPNNLTAAYTKYADAHLQMLAASNRLVVLSLDSLTPLNNDGPAKPFALNVVRFGMTSVLPFEESTDRCLTDLYVLARKKRKLPDEKMTCPDSMAASQPLGIQPSPWLYDRLNQFQLCSGFYGEVLYRLTAHPPEDPFWSDRKALAEQTNNINYVVSQTCPEIDTGLQSLLDLTHRFGIEDNEIAPAR